MNQRGILSAALGAALAFCAFDDVVAQVRVGVSLPMTGPFAVYGQQILPALQQAFDDLNGQGGVLGKPIEPVVIDDRCDPAIALNKAQELVERDHIALMIGPACSSAALATLPYLGVENRAIIMLSAVASVLTERGSSNVFRIVPKAALQGPIVSTYLQRIKGDYNVAVLNDQTPYAGEITDALRRAWPNLDAETKFQAKYSIGQADFTPLIQQLRSSDIAVVYVAGGPVGLGSLILQARAEGLQSLFVGSDTAASPIFGSAARESANGTLATFFPDPNKTPESQQILGRMREKGRPPSVIGLYAYAALQAWAKAATSVGTFDVDRVSAALHSQQFATTIGPVAFDAKGDVREIDYTFYQWHDQTITEVNHRPPPPPPPPPPPAK